MSARSTSTRELGARSNPSLVGPDAVSDDRTQFFKLHSERAERVG
jgi:hypothetical protein